MLGLRLPTDPHWVNIVESNIGEILTDHAYCEQKAASNAISLIVHYPVYPDLVAEMVKIAREELEHFSQVHALILARGEKLGNERKDDYVNELLKFTKVAGRSYHEILVDKLLFSAMIEARSCERFRVLSENIKDKTLAKFYYDLMVSEAGHYTTFISFAKKYGDGVDVDKRWKEFLDYEAKVIASYGKSERIHG
ncbi:MAG: tRNA-(ms[2]io[6]A)-hydroxylase [Bacteroidetes bacterium]|nr:tRNA-(ms[2]io[6]A)-hydroxylase [Bacteroidota bacterium]